jgi:hypothetical protein
VPDKLDEIEPPTSEPEDFGTTIRREETGDEASLQWSVAANLELLTIHNIPTHTPQNEHHIM